jgi:chorismate mutase
MGVTVRGIRGATTVDADEPALIAEATEELLLELVRANDLAVDDIISIIFTVTPDLRSAYPAAGARRLGWLSTPLLGATEMDVPGGLPRCIRVLMHVSIDRPPEAISHRYLRAAAGLRPDLAH